MKLGLSFDAEVVAPGGQLTGRVEVLEGGESRSLTLTVSFRERSPDYLAAVFERGYVIREGDLATGQSLAFACDLPDWATPGVKSQHGELYWEVEAHSDGPGPDSNVRRVVHVAPA